ncbi:hypothetical protein J6590_016839 [Homalodisca vitripennis]|nr:hypothetical protein J6590_016839 [Homalodisca vitripennis]
MESYKDKFGRDNISYIQGQRTGNRFQCILDLNPKPENSNVMQYANIDNQSQMGLMESYKDKFGRDNISYIQGSSTGNRFQRILDLNPKIENKNVMQYANIDNQNNISYIQGSRTGNRYQRILDLNPKIENRNVMQYANIDNQSQMGLMESYTDKFGRDNNISYIQGQRSGNRFQCILDLNPKIENRNVMQYANIDNQNKFGRDNISYIQGSRTGNRFQGILDLNTKTENSNVMQYANIDNQSHMSLMESYKDKFGRDNISYIQGQRTGNRFQCILDLNHKTVNRNVMQYAIIDNQSQMGS